MRHRLMWSPLLVLVAVWGLAGCSNTEPETPAPAATADPHAGHDHDAEDAAPAAAEAAKVAAAAEKEKDPSLGLEENYSADHKGDARITLSYDAETKSFKGFVENIGRDVMEQCHVSIQLSNGQEIGPKTVGNIDPGSRASIELTVEGEFDRWTVQPAVVGALEGAGEAAAAGLGEIGDIEDPNE